MSEQTYTLVVQAVILFVFVLGTLYGDPAASLSASGEPPAARASACAYEWQAWRPFDRVTVQRNE